MFWSEPEAPVHALWTAVTVPALVITTHDDSIAAVAAFLRTK